jgi:hypothetical protein
MALDFPANPSNGDLYENFVYDEALGVWNRVVLFGPTGPTGPVGPAGTNAIFSRQGSLSTTEGNQRLYVERSGIISVVRVSVGTPSSGAAIIVDVLKNGETILSSPIEVVAGDNTSLGTISESSVFEDDYFTVNIIQVGSVTPGANLTVTLTIL